MATVSEVRFTPEGDGAGRCPECGRDGVKLGRVNQTYRGAGRLVCIDCHFGPPREFWGFCPKCNWWQPGESCEKCGATFTTGD